MAHHGVTTVYNKQSAFETGNSTATPLLGDGVFTGATEDVAQYSGITVMAYSDVASAEGGLLLQSSQDGTNWDSSLPVTVGAGIREIHTLAVISSYFRVVYTNGSAGQGEFRLETRFTEDDGKLTSRMSTVISDDYDVQLVRTASEPKLDRAAGLYGEQSAVHKFGANPDVSASSTEYVTYSGTINWLQAATTVRVKAGNTNDSSGGTGAQKVMVEGLDSNWVEASEELTTNGTSAGSAGSVSFIRIYRAYVTDVGTYGGANAADVVIENSAGGTDLLTIGSGLGQSETSEYTVPAGKTAYLTRFDIEVNGSKAATVNFFQRPNADDVTTPFSGKRLIHSTPDLTGAEDLTFDSYQSFPAKTDLWWEATTGSGANTSVSCDYDLVLVND